MMLNDKLQDKSIQCCDCGVTFTFSAGEQQFLQSKGYTNEPRRCPACRQAKKSQRSANAGFSYNASPRRMFPVKCAECGKDTEVPFEPRGEKPVYCSDCYRKVQAR